MNQNRYSQIIERIFFKHYKKGVREVPFDREDIVDVAEELNIELPKNLGDIIYSFRYRSALPQSIRDCAPEGEEWIIRPAGRSRYSFVATALAHIVPNRMLAETKIPDSTPGVIAMYALTDEQALLARLRYNRLVDIFTGVACYSLQSHLRTAIGKVGQVETDEVYVGLDRKGLHYIFPIQAKGGNDVLSVVQVEQDIAMCREKFSILICRPIAAQFMDEELIALFELEQSQKGVVIAAERHYRLVPPGEISPEDLSSYSRRLQAATE